MLGTKKDPTLRTKAAETLGLLLFSQAMATKFGGKFGPDQEHIARLVNSLVRHMEVMAVSPRALVDGGITGLISVECLWFTSSFSLFFTSSFPLFCRVDLFLFRSCEQRARHLWSVLELPTAPKAHMWSHMVDRS